MKLDGLAPISLAELEATAALQVRVERKYVVGAEQARALVQRLAATHACLDIGGLRSFEYRTTYFDTDELLTYCEHLQQRRQRFKVRRRLYVDAGVANFEVKLSGHGAATVKHALPAEADGPLTATERAFLRERVASDLDREVDGAQFRESLTVGARRITLVAPERRERVTLDVAVDVGGWRLAPEWVIVESKSRIGRGEADRVLRGLGARPQRASKYCAGIMLTGHERRGNRFLAFARRFEPAV